MELENPQLVLAEAEAQFTQDQDWNMGNRYRLKIVLNTQIVLNTLFYSAELV